MLEGAVHKQIIYEDSERTGYMNWLPLPPVAMELVLEKSSSTSEKRSRRKHERIKDNDIVIPEELLEELSNVPPTPVSFTYKQVGSYIFYSNQSFSTMAYQIYLILVKSLIFTSHTRNTVHKR